jgi:superfamily I DNA and RNA helicase
VEKREVPELFDAVLVDEAQDLPQPFFRLVYAFAKEPKRVVWAFDELQNLSESTMPTTDEMFGLKADGRPRVALSGNGGARTDIVLPVCYRNTPWALTLAHALGFGIHREAGFVQYFHNSEQWLTAGYEVLSGLLEPGRNVVIRRSAASIPPYFPLLLRPEDAVVCQVVADVDAQAEWVAAEVKSNIEQDELEHDDVLIVLANSLTAKKRAPRVMDALIRHGLASHLVGETASADEIFQQRSIAITHIYRAKGNEAPMVYVLDAHECANGFELRRLRNTLFTAITRSRAWVRLCGYGDEMVALANEVRAVSDAEYNLRFRVPTPDEISRLRSIHRDLAPSERQRKDELKRAAEKFLGALELGEVDWESLPKSLRERFRRQVDDEE